MNARRALRALALVAVAALATPVRAAVDDDVGSAQALRDHYASLKADSGSPFGLPLHLDSQQKPNALRGDIYSRLDHPFAAVRDALRRPAHWCEIMILHPNVKGCRALGDAKAESGHLAVKIGRAEHEVDFAFRIVKMADDYFDVRLDAPTGPAGTTDYRIRVEGTPLDAGKTVMHLAYSHGFGGQAKFAMDAYFATFGRDKVGFSVTGRDAQGKPVYVRDLRGGMERNAMRYYLAIRSYLEVAGQPPAQRLDQGLRKWLAYTERWPLQLREEPGYVDVKLRDIERMLGGS
ncbi:MAG TPA: hypothetical protein VFX05_03925 [Casimicrobiaceae bacterium]|nr:hypothetical protein [Casimicrobiaceae bacterium]